ncbi:MAG: methylmalonyl-CoA mutase subunit beta [Bacteroidota bacterium]
MSDQKLFAEFDSVSAKAWKQKIQVDLKGADYNETLVWESPEGIHIKPFYHSEDVEKISQGPSQTSQKWSIVQHLYAQDARKTNKKVLEVLTKGTEGLYITIPSEEISVPLVLADVDLEKVPVYFDFQFLALDYLKAVVDFARDKKAKFYLNLDIIGNLTRTGNWFHTKEKDHEILKEILNYTAKHEDIHVLGVQLTLYQNAGANIVQQLAYSLGHANEYLNSFDTKGDFPISFNVSVGGNYFMEIAKLRALQRLWTTLASEYGVTSDCHVFAEPSKRNKTLYDYNVNMLRTTTECMSAVLGGARAVCNLPYDALFHKDNAFGERIARNQLLILKGESYFEKVANPTDGSYYIEELTGQLARKALGLFKSIEAGGGFLKQLKEHQIQKKIRESADKEQDLFNKGSEVLVGTNKYINDEDRMQGELKLFPFMKTDKRKTIIEPILKRRLAEDMEQKRLKNE